MDEEEEEEVEEQVIQFLYDKDEEEEEVGVSGKGYHRKDEEEEEKEGLEVVSELPTFPSRADSQDLEEFFRPGSTPPKSERLSKQERRMYKHKKVSPNATSPTPKVPFFKSMSSSDVGSEPFLESCRDQQQSRRSTFPAVYSPYSTRGGKKRGGSCKSHSSLLKEEGENVRGYKKIYQRDRERHRDEKTMIKDGGPAPSPPRLLQFDHGEEEEELHELQEEEDEELHQEEAEEVGFYLPADEENEVDFVDPLRQGQKGIRPNPSSPVSMLHGSHSDGQSVFHSLTTGGFMMIGYEPPRKLQRSQSDAQFSLPSMGKTMVCPPDRKKFYRNFMKTVKLYSHQQQHIPMPGERHLPRQRSEDLSLDNPFEGLMDAIWVELRAYLAGRKNSKEQHQYDYLHRSEVDRVLDDIQKYRFYLDPLFSGTCDREEYEELTSLPTEGTDEQTPHCSLTAKDTAPANGGGDCDGGDEGGPETLVHQASLDSDGSSSSGKSAFPSEIFLNPEQQAALREVQQMLRDLERAESFFPSLKKMADEFSVCLTPQFKRRRDALILWGKVTEGLANHLSWLSKWFGVVIYSVYSRQTSQDYPPTYSPYMGPSRASTSNGDSLRRNVYSQISVASAATTSSGIDPEQSLIRTASFPQTQSSFTSTPTQYSTQWTTSGEEGSVRSYRKFVDRTLKKKGLDWLMKQLKHFITPALSIAEAAITGQHSQQQEKEEEEEEEEFEHTPLIRRRPHPRMVDRVTSTAPLSWVDEFVDMNLPLFYELVRRKGGVESEKGRGRSGE